MDRADDITRPTAPPNDGAAIPAGWTRAETTAGAPGAAGPPLPLAPTAYATWPQGETGLAVAYPRLVPPRPLAPGGYVSMSREPELNLPSRITDTPVLPSPRPLVASAYADAGVATRLSIAPDMAQRPQPADAWPAPRPTRPIPSVGANLPPLEVRPPPRLRPVIQPAAFSASAISEVMTQAGTATAAEQADFAAISLPHGLEAPHAPRLLRPGSAHMRPAVVSPTERLEPREGIAPPQAPAGGLGFVARVVRLAALVAAAWLALVVALIFVYRFIDPPFSSLMVQQQLGGGSIIRSWVPLEAVSPNVVRAVMLSEDGRFCQHHGIDYDALQDAIERAGDGAARGASTISMQVVKNLFLLPSKSYLRKAIEVPLTLLLELVWPKWRIMEVYLNIAEWGPGVFGVEAASRYHFNKSAARLSAGEAARLAVALPNPIRRDAGDPGPQTRQLAYRIQMRMRAAPASQTACALPGRDN